MVNLNKRERPRCYIASPLGFTEGGREYYSCEYLPALSEVVEPVDPWSFVTPTEIENAKATGGLGELARGIGRRNAESIRSCQLLAAYLEGQEIDSGTAAEVGYAAGLGLRCFGLRTDLRDSGDLGVGVNLQVEAFIAQSGGAICASLAELVEALRLASAAGP